jgi:hypothetical protein
MKEELSSIVDNLISKVKEKTDKIGMTSADMFIILTLEILRGEVISDKLTEWTIIACREIRSTTSHFYYYRDYPELYDDLQSTFNEIYKIDSRFFSADLSNDVGFEVKGWTNYLAVSTKNLLESLPTEFFYKK